MDSANQAPVGRRSTESALKRSVLDAAQRLAERRGGLAVSLEGLDFEDCIKEAGVPRSSAYRAWTTKASFISDLLVDLAGPSWQGTAAFDEETIKLASDVVAENMSILASGTPDARMQVIREAVRLGAAQNFKALTSSTEWVSYVALTATITTLQRADEDLYRKVLSALQQSEAYFLEKMAVFYEHMGLILGFKLRAEFGSDYRILASLGAAVVEGMGLRNLLSPDLLEQTFLLPALGKEAVWTLPAIGFNAILQEMVSVTDDYDFTIALEAYLKAES